MATSKVPSFRERVEEEKRQKKLPKLDINKLEPSDPTSLENLQPGQYFAEAPHLSGGSVTNIPGVSGARIENLPPNEIIPRQPTASGNMARQALLSRKSLPATGSASSTRQNGVSSVVTSTGERPVGRQPFEMLIRAGGSRPELRKRHFQRLRELSRAAGRRETLLAGVAREEAKGKAAADSARIPAEIAAKSRRDVAEIGAGAQKAIAAGISSTAREERGLRRDISGAEIGSKERIAGADRSTNEAMAREQQESDQYIAESVASGEIDVADIKAGVERHRIDMERTNSILDRIQRGDIAAKLNSVNERIAKISNPTMEQKIDMAKIISRQDLVSGIIKRIEEENDADAIQAMLKQVTDITNDLDKNLTITVEENEGFFGDDDLAFDPITRETAATPSPTPAPAESGEPQKINVNDPKTQGQYNEAVTASKRGNLPPSQQKQLEFFIQAYDKKLKQQFDVS